MALYLTFAMITTGYSFASDSASKPTSIMKKWFPGHYLQMSYDAPPPPNGVAPKELLEAVVSEPCFKGVEILCYWGILEPKKDDYSGIDRVVKDLDYMHGNNKKVILMLMDIIWHSPTKEEIRKRMPGYLLDDPEYEGGVAGKDRRWRAMLWKPKVNERFNKLIAELGKRLDKHPALAAVVTTETAGNPGSGYTAQKCVAGIKATLAAAAVAFPTTPFMYGLNWLPGGSPSERDGLSMVARHAETLGCGFGGPNVRDIRQYKPAQEPGWTWLNKEFLNKVPTFGAIEWEEFTICNPGVSATYGMDVTKLNFMIWYYCKSKNTPSGWNHEKLIKWLQTNGNGINKTTPKNFN